MIASACSCGLLCPACVPWPCLASVCGHLPSSAALRAPPDAHAPTPRSTTPCGEASTISYDANHTPACTAGAAQAQAACCHRVARTIRRCCFVFFGMATCGALPLHAALQPVPSTPRLLAARGRTQTALCTRAWCVRLGKGGVGKECTSPNVTRRLLATTPRGLRDRTGRRIAAAGRPSASPDTPQPQLL